MRREGASGGDPDLEVQKGPMFTPYMALGQSLPLSWPPFSRIDNGLATEPCLAVRIPARGQLGPVALERRADGGLGPGQPDS